MFFDLVKTDFRRQFRFMIWIYLASLVFSLLALVQVLINPEVVMAENGLLPSIVYAFTLIGWMTFLAVSLFYGILRSWMVLYDQLYSAKAHLYRTLPFSIRQIFSANVLAGLLVLALSLTNLFLNCWILHYGPAGHSTLIQYLVKTLMEQIQHSSLWMIFFAVGLQTSFYLMCGCFGIIMGKGKLLSSILYGLGFYFLTALLTFALAAGIVAGFSESLMNDDLPKDVMMKILTIGCLLYIAGDLLCYGLCWVRLKRGLDVL